MTTGSFRPRSGVGRYARLVLKSEGETVLAIGVGEAESQDGVDGVVAPAWWAWLRSTKNGTEKIKRSVYGSACRKGARKRRWSE